MRLTTRDIRRLYTRTRAVWYAPGSMATERRFPVVLDEFLARARASGERSTGLARLVLASLLVVRMLVVGPPLRDGHVRDWILLGLLAASFVFTLTVDRLVQRPTAGRYTNLIGISVVSDSVLIFVGLGALALWPYPGYEGIIRSPSFSFLVCAMFASALRFSLPLVVTSLITNGTVLGAVLLYDIYGPRHISFQLEELLTIGIVFAASATLAVALVLRGRKLVFQGSRALNNAERAANRLGAYVSPEIAQQAISAEYLKLGGARQPIVCLFSDLRGFTSYTETLPPEQLVAELNGYLDAMGVAIASEGGFIDKFIGDAILVVFGMPQPQSDDAARAIRAARAMQRALAKHNVERRSRGLPSLIQGIGVHSGAAVVGNIGTAARMQHTVMGSVVNVASRLEAATKDTGVAVLISADVVDAAKKSGVKVPELRPLAALDIRGVKEPLAVYCFPDDGFSMQHELPDVSPLDDV